MKPLLVLLLVSACAKSACEKAADREIECGYDKPAAKEMFVRVCERDDWDNPGLVEAHGRALKRAECVERTKDCKTYNRCVGPR